MTDHTPDVSAFRRALINEIISMYHTTRLTSDFTSHILSKPSVQKAFEALTRAAPTPAKSDDEHCLGTADKLARRMGGKFVTRDQSEALPMQEPTPADQGDLVERVTKALRETVLWQDMDGDGTMEVYGIPDDEIEKLSRAAIAGWNTRPTPTPADLPNDVRQLVIAARERWEQGCVSGDALDIALEAFSSRVPYENGPVEVRDAPADQGDLVERVARAIEICAVEMTMHHPIKKYWIKMGWLWPKIARAVLAVMPAVGTYDEGYTAGELKWAEAMDKQIGIEEALRTQLAERDGTIAMATAALSGLYNAGQKRGIKLFDEWADRVSAALTPQVPHG